MDLEPVFLIGAGRSGTKILRDLLGGSPEAAVVPFDVNYIWRFGADAAADDALSPADLSDERRGWIRKRLLAYARRNATLQSRVMIEKTVSNTLRVDFLEAVFPGAKYIHLLRDGRAVSESSRRVWNDKPSLRYSLSKLRYYPLGNPAYLVNAVRSRYLNNEARPHVWGPRYPGVFEDMKSKPLLSVCALQWQHCVLHAREGLSRIPAERQLQIRYEDFVQGFDELGKACAFLDLDPAPVRAGYEKRIRPSNAEKWKTLLSTEEIDQLNELLGETLAQCSYPV